MFTLFAWILKGQLLDSVMSVRQISQADLDIWMIDEAERIDVLLAVHVRMSMTVGRTCYKILMEKVLVKP